MLSQAASKDVPEWMKYSTVHPLGDLGQESTSTGTRAQHTNADTQPSVLLPGEFEKLIVMMLRKC